MKRYTAHVTDDGDSFILESPNGSWVLHSDAQAEIERLRFLVNCAYIEGFYDGLNDHGMSKISMDHVASRWEGSEAKQALSTETPDESK